MRSNQSASPMAVLVFTVTEVLAILAGTVAINAYLVHTDEQRAAARPAPTVMAACDTDSDCQALCPPEVSECDGGPDGEEPAHAPR